MAYIALYRKYRSQRFGELMGQEHVTTTLQNAIKSGKIAHAYLFHGARGCGKTSTARLLARALNCVAQDGPTPEPCGQCRLCISIRDGACMDVIEMDAASETGIDDVREKIIENVQYAPGEARYKVYIIDEVHDLSAKAFDALLKTLEEPPAHVVFILATTELHKVPVTIRSRCQPYHFRRGTVQDLAARVEWVVQAEGCTAEPEAVQALARCAEGSWRDALSLLEQVLAYAEGHVTAETVHRAVGTVGAEMLTRVTETLARGQWDETLAIAGDLIDGGTDVRQLLTALSGHLRDLMLISAGAQQAAMQELGAERVALLRPQAVLFDPPTLLAMMGELSQAEKEIRFTNQHRWLLERTLLRMLPGMQGPDEATGAKRHASRREARDQGSENAALPAPDTRPTASAPLAATPTVVPKPVPQTAQAAEFDPDAAEEAEDDAEEAVVESAPEPPVAAPTSAAAVSPPVLDPPLPTPAADPRFADEVTLDVVRRAWPRILKMVEKVSKPAFTYLDETEVAALEGRVILLSFRSAVFRDRIQNKARDLVEKAINKVLGTEGYKIRCITAEAEKTGVAETKKAAGTSSPPPAFEMGTLLDPPPTPAGTTRIADFDMPAPPAEYDRNDSTNGRDADRVKDPPTQKEEAPASSGLLNEALNIFGGEVIGSEPL
jgi:DNA polymerase-3 subunit gamma/tau